MAIVDPMLILFCVSAQRSGAERERKTVILTLTFPGHKTSDEHIRTADDLLSSCLLTKPTDYNSQNIRQNSYT